MTHDLLSITIAYHVSCHFLLSSDQHTVATPSTQLTRRRNLCSRPLKPTTLNTFADEKTLNMPGPEATPPTKSQQQHASTRMPSTATARLQESDPSWRAKLCLRALAAILSLASASCFCTALAIWPQPASDRHSVWGNVDLPTDALPLFPVRPPSLQFVHLPNTSKSPKLPRSLFLNERRAQLNIHDHRNPIGLIEDLTR